MPAENPGLTNQPAFYVAVSRARDTAELVTDDAHRLADQLERATGERLAALDATAKQAAWETVFGREPAHDRERDHVTRASDAMDRGHGIGGDGQRGREREPHSRHGIDREARREHGHERRFERETGERRGGKSPDRSAGRERSGQDSGRLDRVINRGPGHADGPGRDSGHEKAAEPKQKTPDFDLGM